MYNPTKSPDWGKPNWPPTVLTYFKTVYYSREIVLLHITVASWWALRRLQSPAFRLFTQTFVQVQIKENTKTPRHWPLWMSFTGYRAKGPVTRKMFPFDDVIMIYASGAEKHSGRTTPILRLLNALAPASPGHQQPCYWLVFVTHKERGQLRTPVFKESLSVEVKYIFIRWYQTDF